MQSHGIFQLICRLALFMMRTCEVLSSADSVITLRERSQRLAFFNHLESPCMFLLIHILTQKVNCEYSSSIRVSGMEIQFEDDTISLELLDLPSRWTITNLIPPVVRLCHSNRVSNQPTAAKSVIEALFPTSDYKATSR